MLAACHTSLLKETAGVIITLYQQKNVSIITKLYRIHDILLFATHTCVQTAGRRRVPDTEDAQEY